MRGNTVIALLLAVIAILLGLLSYVARDEMREWFALEPHRPEVERRTDGPSGVVSIDAEAREASGIVVEPIAAVSAAPSREAFGMVLSAQPLVEARTRYRALAADSESVRAAVAAERAELDRLKALYADNRNVSERAVQAQDALVKGNAARLASADHNAQGVLASVRSQWGDTVVTWVREPKSRVIDDLAARRVALVQIALPEELAESAARLRIAVSPIGGKSAQLGRFVSAAPSGDPSLPGRSFLYTVDGKDLRHGLRVVANVSLEQAARRGVAIPRSAVVRFAGKTWAFVARDADTFERREVATGVEVDGGWLNSEGWAPGERVVVSGAQLLLSEERRPRAHGPDED